MGTWIHRNVHSTKMCRRPLHELVWHPRHAIASLSRIHKYPKSRNTHKTISHVVDAHSRAREPEMVSPTGKLGCLISTRNSGRWGSGDCRYTMMTRSLSMSLVMISCTRFVC